MTGVASHQDLGELGRGHPPLSLAARSPSKSVSRGCGHHQVCALEGQGHVTPPVRVL